MFSLRCIFHHESTENKEVVQLFNDENWRKVMNGSSNQAQKIEKKISSVLKHLYQNWHLGVMNAITLVTADSLLLLSLELELKWMSLKDF